MITEHLTGRLSTINMSYIKHGIAELEEKKLTKSTEAGKLGGKLTASLPIYKFIPPLAAFFKGFVGDSDELDLFKIMIYTTNPIMIRERGTRIPATIAAIFTSLHELLSSDETTITMHVAFAGSSTA